MNFKCLIVDDAPLALEVIQTHLKKLDMFEIVASCNNAIEAFNILSSTHIDLIFLDIELPGIKGTDFLGSLAMPPKVIFTTAYREYALEGYELNVVDYLLKPITFERFIKAVNKFLQIKNPTLSENSTNLSSKKENNFIYVNKNKKVYKIRLDDIIYIESQKDYICIFLENDELVVKHTISTIEKELPENDFLRIHRSFIISLKHIKGFTANTIDLGLKEIPIGRNFHKLVFSRLQYKM